MSKKGMYRIRTLNEDLIVPSPEEILIQEERERTISEAMLTLDKEELIFAIRRFGFMNRAPLSIEELHKKYYPNYFIEELEILEEEILRKLGQKPNVKSLGL